MADDQKIGKDLISKIIAQDIRPNAPDYENNIRTKFPGYNVVFMFPTCPVEEEKYLAFPAYVKKVDDKFNVSYGDESVYGRMDPIPVYKNTTRQIQFDLALPSSGLAQSIDIADKLDILVKNLYPSYEKNGSVNILSSPPLVRIFFSNLIYDRYTKNGLLGYINGGVSIIHDLEKGVFSREQGFETYPRAYNLSFIFNVLHEYTPGYTQSENTKVYRNPVNILGRSAYTGILRSRNNQ